MAQQDLNELPVSDLVQRMSQQTADLVRKELELAQVEMKEKGKRAGIGAGLFGGAGLIAAYGVGALIATVILAARHLPRAVDRRADRDRRAVRDRRRLGRSMGKKQVDQATPPQPEQAIRSTKRDVDEVKGRASR